MSTPLFKISQCLGLSFESMQYLCSHPRTMLPPQLLSLTIWSTCITSSEHCRNICVIVDSHATMKRHFNATCRGVYFHLCTCNIAKIKKTVLTALPKTQVYYKGTNHHQTLLLNPYQYTWDPTGSQWPYSILNTFLGIDFLFLSC